MSCLGQVPVPALQWCISGVGAKVVVLEKDELPGLLHACQVHGQQQRMYKELAVLALHVLGDG